MVLEKAVYLVAWAHRIAYIYQQTLSGNTFTFKGKPRFKHCKRKRLFSSQTTTRRKEGRTIKCHDKGHFGKGKQFQIVKCLSQIENTIELGRPKQKWETVGSTLISTWTTK